MSVLHLLSLIKLWLVELAYDFGQPPALICSDGIDEQSTSIHLDFSSLGSFSQLTPYIFFSLLFRPGKSSNDTAFFRGRQWKWCDHDGSPHCKIDLVGPTRVLEVMEEFRKVFDDDKESARRLNFYVIRRARTNTYGIDRLPICMQSFKKIVNRSPTTIKKWVTAHEPSAQGKHESHEKLPRDRVHKWIELGFSSEFDPDGPGEIGPSHYKYAESKGQVLYTHQIQYFITWPFPLISIH